MPAGRTENDPIDRPLHGAAAPPGAIRLQKSVGDEQAMARAGDRGCAAIDARYETKKTG